MRETVAFLQVLNPEHVTFDLGKIHAYLRDKGYVVKPHEEYTPNGWNHRFVVWRFKKMHRLTDREIIEIVGIDGNVLYLWECSGCKRIVRKTEYPKNHNEDIESGCTCLKKT